ncbi:NAD-dependent epimerase/dehydratase family protein [Flavilitoribacter nigricans]|uniref:NAD-dependent epimerase n=1 Tax=Flavilitoribacter nigricans (strain ATCC 23147 / DSM 23189 / NBRC 102662 / NCIMB 1420 / SS-2) TaxID=1122177 RepID=A0A2D0N0U4_FLAN2|nr:NAD-dependent epimerase/dehydratase family protein [Flavilitoribacter nigricans]PHN02151.1 NAD-dependent epimerase [Flavilitoribacter nigricans DSM 23189 = NBRC 102662]
MQTVLGANGQIAEELTRELYRNHTQAIRLVSRNPKKVQPTDQLFSANLLDGQATEKAVEGSDIAYFTVGLPMNSQMWEEQFPTMMQNVIAACKKHRCKLVFFDNTYMYAKTSEPQTEESPFVPIGRKSSVRAAMAEMVLQEISRQSIEAVICRAPEFYGPNKTQSITNTLIFDRIAESRSPRVPLRDDTRRTLIWTPDASRAMALLGNTPEAYQQTWHLPCDDDRPTYRELIDMASEISGQDLKYSVVKMWQFKLGGLFSSRLRELQELLPRYRHDNIFVSDKFKKKFPSFAITSYREGIHQMIG